MRHTSRGRKMSFVPIGVIHTPFKVAKGTPIQPAAGRDIEGTVELFAEFIPGLKDIEGFSHIILIYYFHKAKRTASLRSKPFLDNKVHGIFAIRAPTRPNQIGISVVRLLKVDGGVLHIRDIDILDGTPLLDIKPFFPDFDRKQKVRIGWLEGRKGRLGRSRDDGRFSK